MANYKGGLKWFRGSSDYNEQTAGEGVLQLVRLPLFHYLFHYFSFPFSLFLARAGGRAAELERKSTRVNIIPPKMLQPGEKLSDKIREKQEQSEMLQGVTDFTKTIPDVLCGRRRMDLLTRVLQMLE